MDTEKPGYRLVDHTADLAVEGWAPDLETLFQVMALGWLEVVAEPGSVRTELQQRIAISAPSPQELLHDWLEEINALHQIHHHLYREFSVKIKGENLEAVVQGEVVDLARHRLRTEIKAVTWHDLTLEQVAGGYRAYVLFDI